MIIVALDSVLFPMKCFPTVGTIHLNAVVLFKPRKPAPFGAKIFIRTFNPIGRHPRFSTTVFTDDPVPRDAPFMSLAEVRSHPPVCWERLATLGTIEP
jgi:hypothetical protein